MFQKIKNIYHLLRAFLANLYYGFPSRRLKVIGVTGTDGKTTTTQLITHILKSAGKKVSMISTVYAKVAGKEYDTGFHVTTPDAVIVPKFLKLSADYGDEYFILETTSHRLDQNQLFGINFEICVITNITHEHLDYHKDYEDYVKAKEKLISMAKLGIVNKKDQSYEFFSNESKRISKDYTSKLKDVEKIPNLTKFNRYNYAAAYKVTEALGIDDQTIINAMKTFNLPKGRLEMFYDKGFKIIIDFAHTPNAFLQVLPEIRRMYLKESARLIHVFGSAGLRDATKRSLMGQASSQYSDYIILTEEDFRTEKLEDITRQIASGIKNKPFEVIMNRQEAINRAIKMAKKGDVVVLTGKSHEKSLCRGKIEYPWSEHEAVKKALSL